MAALQYYVVVTRFGDKLKLLTDGYTLYCDLLSVGQPLVEPSSHLG